MRSTLNPCSTFALLILIVALCVLTVCGCGSSPNNGAASAKIQTRNLDLGRGHTLTLVLVPAGEGALGSAPGEEQFPENQPVRRVKIDVPFYLSQCEITQMQYALLTDANPSLFMDKAYPVEQITFEDAKTFCRLLSEKTGEKVRLPTEEEWEYSCRAGATTRFHSGDDAKALESVAWFARNSEERPHAVATKTANRFGLHDMHGNVWEWCEPRAAEGKTPELVARGGSWMDEPQFCRAGSRVIVPAGFKNANLGFRVVVEVKQ